MTFTLGRFSSDRNLSSWEQSGDAVTMTFDIIGSTLAVSKVYRQQVLGLADNDDEPVVPFTDSSDSDRDGYYRVVSAEVNPVQSYQSNFLMRCQVAMTRIGGGFARPAIETSVIAKTVTNSHSVTDANNGELLLASVPSAWEDQLDLSGFGAVPATSNVTPIEGGALTRYVANSATSEDASSITYGTPASHYATPNCVFEVKSGGVWYPVVGRQLPDQYTTWRLNNGLVRVHNDSVSSTGYIFVGGPTGTDTWNDYELSYGNIAVTTFTATPTTMPLDGSTVGPIILRNSPEVVVIRVLDQEYSATWTIWRGGTLAVCAITKAYGGTATHAIGFTSTIASTSVTGGVITTSADGSGDTFVLVSRSNVTKDTTNGAIGMVTGSGENTTVFGVGLNVGDATATEATGETGMLHQLCAPPNWVQRVVSR